MSRENEIENVERPRPTRAQRLAVVGFLAAFALTIATVLWTAYKARLAAAERAAEPAAAAVSSPEGGETPPAPKR